MEPTLKQIEIDAALARDNELPIDRTSIRQVRLQDLDKLREVAVERLLVTALHENFISVAKNERAKAVPLWLEDPFVSRR
jgi:hypothetical protein